MAVAIAAPMAGAILLAVAWLLVALSLTCPMAKRPMKFSIIVSQRFENYAILISNSHRR
jgi:hypothetical protein